MGEYDSLSLCGNCVYCYVDILWDSTLHCHFVGIVSTVMLTYCGRVLSTVTLWELCLLIFCHIVGEYYPLSLCGNCVYCYVDILWESTIHCTDKTLEQCYQLVLWVMCLLLWKC